MLDGLLIANRGEIACRVMRTARRLGVRTVAVYSDADAGAPHVQMADTAVHIGAAPATASYLDIERILAAARDSGATAVHPGYGFLSENADFAEACGAAGLTFVGPSAQAIRSMGSKIEAKRLVSEAGTAAIPGYQGDEQTLERLTREAQNIGYPLLVKASAGGGGKGMRVVDDAGGFEAAVNGARREAMSSFGDDQIFLERYLHGPKHIEVQLLADQAGKTLYLFERDCSVQRRHQKVIEEAPAPGMSEQLRRAMGEAAVRAAQAIGYVGAGTVEFLLQGDEFFFMEMNTRLQVEHPVTEAILGIDLVEWQLRIAAGEPIEFDQNELAIDGHAVEARVYAENPKRNFLPSTGRLHWVSFPPTVRVDSGVETGSEVTVHYDPMIAKVIAHGPDRAAAIAALDGALGDAVVLGVEHNVSYLRRVLCHDEFTAGTYTTSLADRHAKELAPPDDAAATAVAVVWLTSVDAGDPWTGDGFSPNLPSVQTFSLRRGRKKLALVVTRTSAHRWRVEGPDGDIEVRGLDVATDVDGLVRVSAWVDDALTRCALRRVGDEILLARNGGTERLRLVVPDAGAFSAVTSAGGKIVSPMPGQVVSVDVAQGDKVQAGQVVAVVEAMKMEHSIASPAAGTVETVNFKPGDRVEEGAELIVVATA